MARERLPLPKGVPKTLRFESVTFDVIALSDGRLAFAYYAGSKRVVVKRSSVEELRTEAERIALAILNADTAAKDMTADDSRIFVAARDALRPTGLAMDSVARDFLEAWKIVGPVPLRTLADFYRENHIQGLAKITCEALSKLLLAEKDEADLSGRRKRALKNDLALFNAKFGERLIDTITTAEILEWVRDLQKEIGFAWKRRNDLRDAAVCLFTYGRDHNYLPHDRRTAAEIVPRLKKPKIESQRISIYSPDEMRAYISNILPRFFPWLIICGFSPIRSEEVAPDKDSNKDGLRWEDFRWAKNDIRVRPETSKVGKLRYVPLSDQLRAWLEPEYRNARGLICPGEQPSKRETGRLGSISGAEVDGRWVRCEWKQNALRHTILSALLGLRDEKGQPVNSRSHVSEIGGTSEKRLKENYEEPMEHEQAAAWLAIMPNRPENVIVAPMTQTAFL